MLDHGRVHAIGSADDVVREMRFTILHHDLDYAREEGSKEVEIVDVAVLRDGRPLDGIVVSGETLTLQVDLRAADPVLDPVVSFALHDAANNFVFGDDTARLGVDLGTVEGSRRLAFELGPIPVTGGKYWLTVAAHSRDNARVFHVLEQRSSFEVQQADGRRDQLSIPVSVRLEDL
jgi:hypothetical protein